MARLSCESGDVECLGDGGMAELLVKPASGAVVHDITPQSAGWRHVGFGLHDLAAGGVIDGSGDGNELCIVLLSGAVSVSAGDVDFGHIHGRESVFDGVPAHAFYVPMQTT